MNLGEANKQLWLWLRRNGGYWTAAQVAQRTGYAPANVFRALHDMSRRMLVEQVNALPGERQLRYGVSDDCLVPLGLTVAEATTGIAREHALLPRTRASCRALGAETYPQAGLQ